MGERAFLAIGCDTYDYFPNLSGAEQDARNVAATLEDARYGDYEREQSQLLESPRLADVTDALRWLTKDGETPEVLTVYYAGHGAFHNGKLYLATRDTKPSQLSLTAWPINTLMTILTDIRPMHSHIVIDACHAAGSAFDLHSLLTPELVGADGSIGVSLLAMSMVDQYSSETASGGIATRELLGCIDGTYKIHAESEWLDLIEVGLQVSRNVDVAECKQTPVVWGLNLYGHPRLSRNPHFDSPGGGLPHFHIPPKSAAGRVIDRNRAALWSIWTGVSDEIDARKAVGTLREIRQGIANNEQYVAFLSSFQQTLLSVPAVKDRPFGTSETAAVLYGSSADGVDDESIRAMFYGGMCRFVADVAKDARRVIDETVERPRALLDSPYPIAQLITLPLRLSKILGYCGASLIVDRAYDGIGVTGLRESVLECIKTLTAEYDKAFVTVTDEQAPYVYIGVVGLVAAGERALASDISDRYFAGFVECGGRVLDPGSDASNALLYLVDRAHERTTTMEARIANPGNMLAALLLAGTILNKGEEWDRQLHHLDHRPINVYVPDRVSSYSQVRMEGGTNLGIRVGFGVWSLDDFDRWMSETVKPEMELGRICGDAAVLAAVVMATLALPDRVPAELVDAVRLVSSEGR